MPEYFSLTTPVESRYATEGDNIINRGIYDSGLRLKSSDKTAGKGFDL